MPIRRLLAIGFLLSAVTLVVAKDSSTNWPQWRGPSGQGYSTDTHAVLRWSETENIIWKTKLPGKGNSTPIVWKDRVFLTAAKGNDRVVFCVRTGDGKILWEKRAIEGADDEKSHPWNGHASPSCVTDGKHVWAFFGTLGLFCYDIDGKFVWKHHFGTFTSKAGWGTGASPFLFEDTIIQNCDNDGGEGAAPAALVALDKLTGKERWSTPRDQGRGFSTPRLMQVAGGRSDLVLNGPSGVWGYDPRSGKERWHVERFAAGELHKFGEPMPVDDGKRIFIASGRKGPYQILQIPGAGDLTKSHILHAGLRDTHRDVASPILWKGKVYCVDIEARLSCYDLATGKEIYNGLIGSRKNKSLASPIAVRGKLLWVLDDGQSIVVEPGNKLKIAGKNKLDGNTLDFGASPAVADGKLYLRSQSYLYCIGEKK